MLAGEPPRGLHGGLPSDRSPQRSRLGAAADALRAGVYALMGCVLASALMATADVLAYADGGAEQATQSARLLARLGLFSAAGTLLGVLLAMVVMLARLAARSSSRVWPLLASATALAAPLLADETIRVTLSGVMERQPEIGRWMYIGATYGVMLGAALLAWLVIRSAQAIARGRSVAALVLASLLLALASALAWCDLTVMVALYARAHRLLESVAWLAAAAGFGLLCSWLGARTARLRTALAIGAGLALLWSVQLIRRGTELADIEQVLVLSRRHSGYATRMRLRAALMQDFLRDPSNWQGAQAARVDRLKRRYDIVTTELAPKWDLPRNTPAAAPALPRDLNVLVIFVDTLRADIAQDPRIMPNVAALSARSLSFEHAFTTASDTVSALPVLTGGCYGKTPCEGDVLALARREKLATAIVMARSARRFLAKQAPAFQFDEAIDIADYAEGKKVWGYGADQSSAAQVSQATLDWLDRHPGERFMLWSFHFDVHNWLQLDQGYLAKQAQRHDIVRDEKLWRYRAAAAGVDEAIGQLIDGLQARGLTENTAIALISDHGEGLGRDGHWQHAVYLWDTLVRVPLLLHVPTLPPAQISRPVGHVDVAPTLAQLIDPDVSLARYHGVPLHADSAQHDLPLLLFSMRKNDLLRVGVIGRQLPAMKLELPIDSVDPELYALSPSGDGADVRDQHAARALRLLSELVTSPVFPRPDPDEKEGAQTTASTR